MPGSKLTKDWGKPDRKSKQAYDAVHRKLRAKRGPAKDFQCDCGNQAGQWAYMHTDPKQRFVYPNVDGGRAPFSSDIRHYKALCTICHRRLDRAQAYKRTVEARKRPKRRQRRRRWLFVL